MSDDLTENGGNSLKDLQALAASPRNWIDEVVRPRCQTAAMVQRRKAELEWLDIAGKVDTKATLWAWAWGRFPAVVHPDLPGVNEPNEVTVHLTDGNSVTGDPDHRESERGQLVMIAPDESGALQSFGPMSIDQITRIQRTDEQLE